MTTRRSVADRLKRLKSDAVKSQTTLNMAEIMLRGLAQSEENLLHGRSALPDPHLRLPWSATCGASAMSFGL